MAINLPNERTILMPKYEVYAIFNASKYLGTVEADNADDAAEKLAEEAYVSICHQCSNEIEIGDCNLIEAQLVKE